MYYSFFIHLSVHGHLGCFPTLDYCRQPAMNVGVNVSFWTKVFSAPAPRSEIAQSYGSSGVCVLSRFSCVGLCHPMDYSLCPWHSLSSPFSVHGLSPLSMAFSRQEHRNELPCPPPGDLPHPGIKPESSALHSNSLPLSHWSNPWQLYSCFLFFKGNSILFSLVVGSIYIPTTV